MFTQFLITAFLTSLVAAVQMDPLIDANSSGPAKVTWQNEAADTSKFAAFSIFLHHPDFRNDFAIANNVRPNTSPLLVYLPVVPAKDGYTLRATNVGNINEEYSQSAPFAIGAEISTTSTTSTDLSSTASGSTSISPNTPTTTAPFGSTVTNANTRTTGAGTGTGTGTSAANVATGTSFNAAPRLAFDFSSWSSLVVVALCAVVGGVVVVVA